MRAILLGLLLVPKMAVVQGALLASRSGKSVSGKGTNTAFLDCLAAISPATCAAPRVVAESLDAQLYAQDRQYV